MNSSTPKADMNKASNAAATDDNTGKVISKQPISQNGSAPQDDDTVSRHSADVVDPLSWKMCICPLLLLCNPGRRCLQ
ncbi:hypothetical protein QR680_000822 [Steinernema hermaphroditum]|uniref:Uncharacterized protein n=1 Tax=Steinernema hermaphroditum TaxID=289476 RepID=A0AA39LEB6_9BILA|nr:hypothetical protein QR680_000822 [Steinernema hermaphroditum]